MGNDALYLNTTGTNNTAVGSGALFGNSTGISNTAVGYQALTGTSTGSYNTAMGYSALTANTRGQYNTAMGYWALVGNTTGNGNTALGYQALYSNKTGTYNIAVGNYALTSNVTGSNNTALGYNAGYDVLNGGQNIIIGYYPTTGVGITSGSNNILIGYDLQKLTQTSSNQLDIGNLIFATGLASGTTLSTGSVGIGTSSPSAMLDIGNKGTTLGTLRLESSTAASYVQLQPSTTSGSWTMTLPWSAGTSGYVLQTDGSGNTSWVSQGSGATINLGTSASVTNPQRSGQPGTGIFSATSNTVSIAANSTDEADFASTGLNLPVATESYQINGVNALWQDNANYNLAVGDTAFSTNVAHGGTYYGQYDTTVGYLALSTNTTGCRVEDGREH